MRTIAPIVIALATVAVATALDEPALKSLAPPGLRIGVALNRAQIEGADTRSRAIVERHFNSITPENIFKWEVVHPEPDRYDFAAADQFVELGRAHGMFVVGHTLVWHQQVPDWVFAGPASGPPSLFELRRGFGAAQGRADREALLARLRAHIHRVVGRYRDRIHGWDVVNEALEEDGTLRRTPWLAAIGEDYIAKAFEFAREADPLAELYYNDYNLWKPAKRDAAIKLVTRLRAQGLRVDAIGEQAHWGLAEPPIAQIDEMIVDLASRTGRVLLTELDIDVLPRDPEMWGADLSRKAAIRATTNVYPTGLPDEQQRQLAQRYAEIFEVVLKRRARVARVTFWGVTDAQSWLHEFPIPGRVNYPLLWDRQGQPKPAFDAVVEVLRTRR